MGGKSGVRRMAAHTGHGGRGGGLGEVQASFWPVVIMASECHSKELVGSLTSWPVLGQFPSWKPVDSGGHCGH